VTRTAVGGVIDATDAAQDRVSDCVNEVAR
jgi:hypothetical protein